MTPDEEVVEVVETEVEAESPAEEVPVEEVFMPVEEAPVEEVFEAPAEPEPAEVTEEVPADDGSEEVSSDEAPPMDSTTASQMRHVRGLERAAEARVEAIQRRLDRHKLNG